MQGFQDRGGSHAESHHHSVKRERNSEHPLWFLRRTAGGPSAPPAHRTAVSQAALEGWSAPRHTAGSCAGPASGRDTSARTCAGRGKRD